jgi:hypothetical protein
MNHLQNMKAKEIKNFGNEAHRKTRSRYGKLPW